MLQVGITGGIGSGKSVIAKVFENLGYPVYNSDVEAKKIYVEDAALKNEVIAFFGEECYDASGNLNKIFLANQVFKDDKKLKKLNELVHPRLKERYEHWLIKQNSPIVFKEAAILMEIGAYKDMDATILVVANEEERIARVMMRDGGTREDVLARMNKQWSDEKKRQLADKVVLNDNSLPILAELIDLPLQLLHNKRR